jgi:hypothetical protein
MRDQGLKPAVKRSEANEDASGDGLLVCVPICLGVTDPMWVDRKGYEAGQAIVFSVAIVASPLLLLLHSLV